MTRLPRCHRLARHRHAIEARTKARTTWDEAGRRTRADYRAWIEDQLGIANQPTVGGVL